VVAAAENDAIGHDNALPWHLPADLRRFASLTRGHAVVMGRGTHESIVARLGQPLPGRRSIVVSRRGLTAPAAGIEVAASPTEAAEFAEKVSPELGKGDWFVIGGASIYQQLLGRVDVIELTRVHTEIEGDARMPRGWLDGFTVTSAEHDYDEAAGLAYTFFRLERDNLR